jgi:hypothetical protein
MRAATASRSEERGEPAERATVIAAVRRLRGRGLQVAAHQEGPLARRDQPELARPGLEHLRGVQRLELGPELVPALLQRRELGALVAQLGPLLEVAPDRADVADEERGEQARDDEAPG